MPSILASAIVDKAEIVIQDTTNVRWPAAELLGWLNDGQREICIDKPDACVLTVVPQLVAGTKQSIGSGLTATANILLKITRNMGTNGTTPGRAIRPVAQEILDAQNPEWHTDTTDAEVIHYVYDPRVPKQYYVWPPQPASGMGYVEVTCGASPTDVANLATAISVDDIFSNALLDYILYRAYSKDAKYAGNGARAAAHYQQFANAIGRNSRNLATLNPSLDPSGLNPNVPGPGAGAPA